MAQLPIACSQESSMSNDGNASTPLLNGTSRKSDGSISHRLKDRLMGHVFRVEQRWLTELTNLRRRHLVIYDIQVTKVTELNLDAKNVVAQAVSMWLTQRATSSAPELLTRVGKRCLHSVPQLGPCAREFFSRPVLRLAGRFRGGAPAGRPLVVGSSSMSRPTFINWPI